MRSPIGRQKRAFHRLRMSRDMIPIAEIVVYCSGLHGRLIAAWMPMNVNSGFRAQCRSLQVTLPPAPEHFAPQPIALTPARAESSTRAATCVGHGEIGDVDRSQISTRRQPPPHHCQQSEIFCVTTSSELRLGVVDCSEVSVGSRRKSSLDGLSYTCLGACASAIDLSQGLEPVSIVPE